MRYLMGLTHPENPRTVGRDEFTHEERGGAELFAAHCQSCHEPRYSTVTGDPNTSERVLESQWERVLFSREGALVFGAARKVRTGVEPYVHDHGARVPSLRRVADKYPYFTNGRARSLDEVLARARFDSEGFRHDGPPTADTSRFSTVERRRLVAFLELL
jgi:cytochrome c peroxidase